MWRYSLPETQRDRSKLILSKPKWSEFTIPWCILKDTIFKDEIFFFKLLVKWDSTIETSYYLEFDLI